MKKILNLGNWSAVLADRVMRKHYEIEELKKQLEQKELERDMLQDAAIACQEMRWHIVSDIERITSRKVLDVRKASQDSGEVGKIQISFFLEGEKFSSEEEIVIRKNLNKVLPKGAKRGSSTFYDTDPISFVLTIYTHFNGEPKRVNSSCTMEEDSLEEVFSALPQLDREAAQCDIVVSQFFEGNTVNHEDELDLHGAFFKWWVTTGLPLKKYAAK